MTEGLPRIYVPVCKHPKHYQRTTGPLGWVEVDKVKDCPLLVEPPKCSKCNSFMDDDGWPDETGGKMCQMCWESECDGAWWEMIHALAKLRNCTTCRLFAGCHAAWDGGPRGLPCWNRGSPQPKEPKPRKQGWWVRLRDLGMKPKERK